MDFISNKLASKGYLVISNENKREDKVNEKALAAIYDTLSSLGFALSPEDYKRLGTLKDLDLSNFYSTSYSALSRQKGAHTNHLVFYRDFPFLEKISPTEYAVRAVLHYITASEYDMGFMNQDLNAKPEIKREEVHNDEKELVKLITEDEAKAILIEYAKDCFAQKTTFSVMDYHLLRDIFERYRGEIHIDEIPNKENMSSYAGMFVDRFKLKETFTPELFKFAKTATDVLRIYAITSCGEGDLFYNVDFISLPRKCRKVFLSVLENIAATNPLVIEDMARNEFMWKLVFEKLHVGEYKDEYPLTYECSRQLRNDDYVTFYGKLETLKKEPKKYVDLLSTRPGEFLRHMDVMVRDKSFDLDYILKKFELIASDAAAPLLVQLWNFYSNRNDLHGYRVIKFNKSANTVFISTDENREKINSRVVKKIKKAIEKALKEKFASNEKMTKVYLDPSLASYAVPLAQRNASSQHHTLSYGTKIKLDDKKSKYIRFFTHWKNMKVEKDDRDSDGRIDIDLSMIFFDDDLNAITSLAWHNMSAGQDIDAFHSGDIITAPKGASEFIDVDVKKASEKYRYGLICSTVFNGAIGFDQIPECFSGVMFLNEKAKEGEIFNAEFVKYKYDLTQANCRSVITLAVDFKERELIWLDIPLPMAGGTSVMAYNGATSYALEDVLKTRMDLYTLFKLHSKHVKFTKNIKDAKIVISDKEGADITPFDLEKISSKWL